MAAETFDAIVIGTGQGGKPLAHAFAGAGKKTAIIERGDVGGTCVNTGCTPTKTMAGSAKAIHTAGRGGFFGFSAGEITTDLERVRGRKREIVDGGRRGNESWMTSIDGLALIRGDATFTGPDTVDVELPDGGNRKLSSPTIVVNTGAEAVIPPIDGLERIPYLDNESIMELDTVPEHLAVIGGGYIGVEFGQMFRRFGANVTIVQRAPRLLPREDEDITNAVREILEDDGIEVAVNSELVRVEAEADGRYRVYIEDDEGARSIVASHVLVAAGRRPATHGLGCDAAGIELDDRGAVRVDERLRTSANGVWAIGDVKGGPAFTHISYDDYRILEANMLAGGSRTITDRLVPYTVFIDPQLGRVGISEREARERGLDVQVLTMPVTRVAIASEKGETRGMLKAVVERGTNRILGFSALAYEGGELISLVEVAMIAGLPATALRDAVFTHPSLAEALNNLFAKLET